MKTYNQKQAIFMQLRRAFSRHPLVRETLNKAIHPLIVGPRGGKQYVCKQCNKTFPGNKVQVDHIDPVVPVNSCINDMFYQELIDRLFCEKENLQVLCKECHKIKTNKERKLRTKYRKEKKEEEQTK